MRESTVQTEQAMNLFVKSWGRAVKGSRSEFFVTSVGQLYVPQVCFFVPKTGTAISKVPIREILNFFILKRGILL